MINQLNLHYFKCFHLLKLPLRPLTLLSGPNSSGKSSAMQSLVLLNQTIREHEWSKRLMLNGNSLQLGTVGEVVDELHGKTAFEIGLIDSDVDCHWHFTSEDKEEMSMEVRDVIIDSKVYSGSSILHRLFPQQSPNTESLSRRLRELSYITAERVGPREIYKLQDRQSASVVGPVGEHAASVLYWGQDETVLPGLAMGSVPNTRLHQVEERMRSFFPGCSLELTKIEHANAVTLGLRTTEATKYHRPIHVGFGLTQILPVVIAILSAVEDSLVLIENPEVHLHPAGQAKMGHFLAEAASSGVQVIVETHSDHVLNGIRRAVKDRVIDSDRVALHFFTSRDKPGSQVESPQLNEEGDIDSWPEGFFDQFDKDSGYFAGWS